MPQAPSFLDSIVPLDIKTEARSIGQPSRALALAIDKDSKAAAAGLVEGDIIASITGKPFIRPRKHSGLAQRSGHPLLLGLYSAGCHTPGHFQGKPDMARYLGGSEAGFEMTKLGVFYGPTSPHRWR